MSQKYTPASFTKNFSWRKSYKRLHSAIRNGFSQGLEPVTREAWRGRSKIDDSDRQLVPMNFFLYTRSGLSDDFILVDRMVEIACGYPYMEQFAKLALFAFHLANSGSWRNSKWPDGRVAGWANELVRERAWKDGSWTGGAFDDKPLEKFIEDRIEAKAQTRRKVLTNYRYMLDSAGVLVDGKVRGFDFGQTWCIDAVQLFWDRQIFDGMLPPSASAAAYEGAFFQHEIFKLLGCSQAQGQAIARAAYREYSKGRSNERDEQLQKLRDRRLIAA